MAAEPTCRFCGCTDRRGCGDGCYWVLPDVCSRCAKLQLEAAGMSYAPEKQVTLLFHEMEQVVRQLQDPQVVVALGRLLEQFAGELLLHAGVYSAMNGLEPTGAELSQDEIDALDREEQDGPFEETPRLWRPGDPV